MKPSGSATGRCRICGKPVAIKPDKTKKPIYHRAKHHETNGVYCYPTIPDGSLCPYHKRFPEPKKGTIYYGLPTIR